MICTTAAHLLVHKGGPNSPKHQCAFFVDFLIAALFLSLGLCAATNKINLYPASTGALLATGIILTIPLFLTICVGGLKQCLGWRNEFLC